ncbi:TPA: hypothetical protein NI644_001943 [Pseudomonas aeruginosa]|nr:hypothetical protein [Pseudomonas aeruginosa]MBI7359238.1 hypothetical protein [Pseudomonas aeruginosa]HCF9264897.1 hypothetical protein [Pseudomonas aeruginosa]HCF9271017.1 hypothetical protein [Pseudomonas aeruginosa]HCF9407881.1 hypothetical protein [Pseudomonas aeruginosa]HCF9414006.1 hypothetical protein [Pseudomonas aeruginosa]
MPDMREEFEAWATNRCVSITKAPEAMMFFGGRRVPAGCYIMADTELAWEAWKASRAALRVELPEKMEPTRNIYGNLIIGSYNAVLDAVKEALQQAGIEVK